MSGIAGVFHLDGRPADRDLLARMSQSMAHRGPDGAGLWISGPVGLAHRMLHTTPESLRETQPLQDESGELCLVLDGRIDNRDELQAAIEAHGLRLRDDTDAELVLRSYQAWGEECGSKMIGDFAFALWNQRERRLVCVRDALGGRPLFYRFDGRTLCFASEMRTLFSDPTFCRRPNLRVLGTFLTPTFTEREETLYQGILRLPLAQVLVADEKGISKRQYWDVDPARTVRYGSDDQYADHFRHLFLEAVRRQMRSHQPITATLSGGLDSSSIVGAAGKLLQEGCVARNGFDTFSIVFPGPRSDEQPYIEAVNRMWGLSGRMVGYEEASRYYQIGETAPFPDVFYDPTRMMLLACLEGMRARGSRVLLFGIGGDELLQPNFHYLAALALEMRFWTLFSEARVIAGIYNVSPAYALVNYCIRPLASRLPLPVRALLRPLSRRLWQTPSTPLLDPRFAAEHGLDTPAEPPPPQITRFPTREQQLIYRAIFFGWNSLVSREMTDLMLAQSGVECRYPFLHRPLVEFVLALPPDQFTRGGCSRFILRQGLRDILPNQVWRRVGKGDFTGCLDQEFRHRQADRIERLLRQSAIAALGLADRDHLVRVFQQYRVTGGAAFTGQLLQLVGLELWCREACGAASTAHPEQGAT